jgi:hypothetical protein
MWLELAAKLSGKEKMKMKKMKEKNKNNEI